MNAILERLSAVGRNDWDTAVDWASLSKRERLDAARVAADTAQAYVELSEYVYGRAAGLDHIPALKESSGLLRRVRKAMGYTFP